MSEQFCNRCGLSCRLPAGDNPNVNHGLVNCTVTGGWDSTPGNGWGALDDCTRYDFSLCEFCLDWLFSTFKNPVHVTEITVDGIALGTLGWRPAKERVENDEWRTMRDEFYTELQRRLKAMG